MQIFDSNEKAIVGLKKAFACANALIERAKDEQLQDLQIIEASISNLFDEYTSLLEENTLGEQITEKADSTFRKTIEAIYEIVRFYSDVISAEVSKLLNYSTGLDKNTIEKELEELRDEIEASRKIPWSDSLVQVELISSKLVKLLRRVKKHHKTSLWKSPAKLVLWFIPVIIALYISNKLTATIAVSSFALGLALLFALAIKFRWLDIKFDEFKKRIPNAMPILFLATVLPIMLATTVLPTYMKESPLHFSAEVKPSTPLKAGSDFTIECELGYMHETRRCTQVKLTATTSIATFRPDAEGSYQKNISFLDDNVRKVSLIGTLSSELSPGEYFIEIALDYDAYYPIPIIGEHFKSTRKEINTRNRSINKVKTIIINVVD
jgi:hypothetical protein